MPHLIPADAATGLTQDLILYENAVIFAGPANGQAHPGKVAFLQVPEMIKVGETWKFVELPRAVDPEKPVMAAEGGIRSWIFRQQAGGAGGRQTPRSRRRSKALADYDNANAKVQAAGRQEGARPVPRRPDPAAPRGRQGRQEPRRAAHLRQADRRQPGRRLPDGLLSRTGLKLLDGLIEAKGASSARTPPSARSRPSSPLKNDEPARNLMANQKKWMADLKAFLDKYPKSDEAPDALLQLASANEFNAEEDEARKYLRPARPRLPRRPTPARRPPGRSSGSTSSASRSP